MVNAPMASMMIDSVCILSPHFMRSHKRTYPSETKKKAIVTAVKIASCIAFSPEAVALFSAVQARQKHPAAFEFSQSEAGLKFA